MKKKIAFAFIFSVIFCSLISAKSGIGIQGGIKFSPSFDGNAGINLRSDFSPWGICASVNFKEQSADLFLDNWWIYKKINSNVNWFALWGMSFGGRLKNECYAETGARAGLGVNVFCFKNRCLEFYSHAVWNPSLGINYDRDEEKFSFRFVPACFPLNAGLRFWF